jgi:hypothetical protein
MTPKRLKQLAENPEHIPGVYNYCDRWCERCPLTRRCPTYAMELEDLEEQFDAHPAAVGDRDQDNAKFWNALAGNMSLVRQMIEEDCRERGMDFEAICREADSAEAKQREREHTRRTRQDALVKAGDRYMKEVDAWFKRHKARFDQEGCLTDGAGGRADAPLRDAVGVIRWYYMFIGVKLARAVGHGYDRFDDENDDDDGGEGDGEPCRDALGSAKIALIAMDRSLAAWGRLHEHLPPDEKGDPILDLLVRLDRLRRATEERFPTARAFIRPGWDDGTLA